MTTSSLLLPLLLLLRLTASTDPFLLRDLSYEGIEALSESLSGRFASSSSALIQYKLPEAVSKHHLRFHEQTGKGNSEDRRCSPIILRVSDTSTLFKDTGRPQVLISGEVHGNERVGPVASINTARLLVWAARCEIEKDQGSCKHLADINVTMSQRSWLTYLATRRDIYVLPAANCMGYLKNVREDLGTDPNRDFSYCRNNPYCFKSLSAQTFRALFAHSLIQIVVTFHGGMEAIGYEWGTEDKAGSLRDKSPDHNSHHQIASILSKYSGGFERSPPYRYDTMNAIVYPVKGSMEDWMYASAWDKKKLTKCVDDNFFTTPIDNGRSEVFLVETSNSKRPLPNSMGSLKNVLDPSLNLPVNGHATRNIRLALASIDLVEPYVCIRNVHIDSSKGVGNLYWYVGGASSVDATFLTVQSASVSVESLLNADNQGSKLFLHNLISDEHSEPPTAKKIRNTQWSPGGIGVDESKASSLVTESFQLPKQAGIYWIIANARVDKSWGAQSQGNPSDIPPQSHLANARTNKAWNHEISSTYFINYSNAVTKAVRDDKKVQGRLYWPSDPIVVEVDTTGDARILSEVYDCRWWSRNVRNTANTTIEMASTSPSVTSLETPVLIVEDKRTQHDDAKYHNINLSKSVKEAPKRFRLMFTKWIVGVIEYLMYYLGFLYMLISLIFLWYCYCRMKQTVKLKSYE